MLCLYRVKPGREEEFKRLLKQHWTTLQQAGLATDQPAKLMLGSTKEGKNTFIEMFQWKNYEAPGIAHQSAEVMALWGPMGELTDNMEFLALRPVD
jgi:hypothetical protein